MLYKTDDPQFKTGQPLSSDSWDWLSNSEDCTRRHHDIWGDELHGFYTNDKPRSNPVWKRKTLFLYGRFEVCTEVPAIGTPLNSPFMNEENLLMDYPATEHLFLYTAQVDQVLQGRRPMGWMDHYDYEVDYWIDQFREGGENRFIWDRCDFDVAGDRCSQLWVGADCLVGDLYGEGDLISAYEAHLQMWEVGQRHVRQLISHVRNVCGRHVTDFFRCEDSQDDFLAGTTFDLLGGCPLEMIVNRSVCTLSQLGLWTPR
jgi:hypothetical protein